MDDLSLSLFLFPSSLSLSVCVSVCSVCSRTVNGRMRVMMDGLFMQSPHSSHTHIPSPLRPHGSTIAQLVSDLAGQLDDVRNGYPAGRSPRRIFPRADRQPVRCARAPGADCAQGRHRWALPWLALLIAFHDFENEYWILVMMWSFSIHICMAFVLFYCWPGL